jgi:hypothetical protein
MQGVSNAFDKHVPTAGTANDIWNLRFVLFTNAVTL